MEYFNIQGLTAYQLFSDTNYDENNEAATTFYRTREQLAHFVRTFVNPNLGTNFQVVYKTKPNRQAGQGRPFKHADYVLVGVNLSQSLGKEIFLKFEFGNLFGTPNFNINLDVDFKTGASYFLPRRNQIYNSTYKEYSVNTDFPKTYEDLFKLIKDDLILLIKKLAIYNTEIMNRKYIDLLNNKKQIILQGPPGTGKTRLANQLAKALIGDQGKDDQIVIVQFHPNFAYEDFVEGLKAEAHGSQVVYKTEDGIFKSFCKKALVSCLNQTNVTSQNISLETHYVSWLRELEKEKPFCQTKYGSSIIFLEQTDQGLSIRYEFKNNQKLEPATSVYPILKEKLFRLLSEDVNPHTITNIKTDIKPIIGSLAGEYFAVYRHFYDYLKTNNVELQELSDEELNFDEALSLFKEPSNRVEIEKQKTYVIIIDEMNRANLSTVFGELISLMEDGKRLGSDEAMTVRLPYSKESFAIPNNVYMIGTMNTADRSVSQIDYAIRRRFAFVDVLPTDLTNDTSVKFDAGLFKEVSKLFVGEGNHLSAEFKAHQVQLGHSYFIKKTDNKETMQMRLDYEIKPILREYVNDGILKQTAVEEIEKLQCSE